LYRGKQFSLASAAQLGHVNDRASDLHLDIRAGLHPVSFSLTSPIAGRQLGNAAHLTNFIILLVEAPRVEEFLKFAVYSFSFGI